VTITGCLWKETGCRSHGQGIKVIYSADSFLYEMVGGTRLPLVRHHVSKRKPCWAKVCDRAIESIEGPTNAEQMLAFPPSENSDLRSGISAGWETLAEQSPQSGDDWIKAMSLSIREALFCFPRNDPDRL